MDNGLLFPYRRRTAHTEAGDTNHPLLHVCLYALHLWSVCRWCSGAWDLIW